MEEKIRFKIFSKEEYDKIFDEIKGLPLHMSPKEITDVIRSKIYLPLIMQTTYPKHILNLMPIYRVRVSRLDEVINEDRIDSFGCPPIPPNKHGRVNRKGQTVFYSSGDMTTPFFEKSDDIILGESIAYLSKWQLAEPPVEANVASSFYGVEEGSETFASAMALGMRTQFKQVFSRLPPQALEAFEYCMLQYNNLFTVRGEEYYHITSSIAYQTMESIAGSKDIPILVYPSVATNKSTVNFAFRKDFSDKYLVLKEIHKVTAFGS